MGGGEGEGGEEEAEQGGGEKEQVTVQGDHCAIGSLDLGGGGKVR